jgi:hypothetical protein
MKSSQYIVRKKTSSMICNFPLVRFQWRTGRMVPPTRENMAVGPDGRGSTRSDWVISSALESNRVVPPALLLPLEPVGGSALSIFD